MPRSTVALEAWDTEALRAGRVAGLVTSGRGRGAASGLCHFLEDGREKGPQRVEQKGRQANTDFPIPGPLVRRSRPAASFALFSRAPLALFSCERILRSRSIFFARPCFPFAASDRTVSQQPSRQTGHGESNQSVSSHPTGRRRGCFRSGTPGTSLRAHSPQAAL